MSLVAVLTVLAAIGLLLAFDPGGAIDRNPFPALRDMGWKELTAWAFRTVGIGLSMLIVVWLWFKYLPNRRVKYPDVSGSSVWERTWLPAAAVSVLEDRFVNDRTLLAALVEMCQRGTLQLECAAAGDAYEYRLSQHGSSRFEWERSICLILPSDPVTVHELRDRLEFHKEALGDQLGDYLESRGLFDDNPVRVMREHDGEHTELETLAGGLMGAGSGLWSALWLSQWWANSLIGLAIGCTYLIMSTQTSSGTMSWQIESGRMPPTQAGALEIGRARALKESLSRWEAGDQGRRFRIRVALCHRTGRSSGMVRSLGPAPGLVWLRRACIPGSARPERGISSLHFLIRLGAGRTAQAPRGCSCAGRIR